MPKVTSACQLSQCPPLSLLTTLRHFGSIFLSRLSCRCCNNNSTLTCSTSHTASVTRNWKNCRNFYNVAQKVAFYLKVVFFEIAQEVTRKVFGLLLQENLLQRTFKNCPIWSHCTPTSSPSYTIIIIKLKSILKRNLFVLYNDVNNIL